MTVATYDDVLAIEHVPLAERKFPPTPYDMLRVGAAIAPEAPALTFLAEASRFKEATVWSHRELFRRITQAGNLFRRLGVERDDAVAFILPNLPESHLAIQGRRSRRDRARHQPSPRGRTVCRAALKRETPDSMFSMALFCT